MVRDLGHPSERGGSRAFGFWSGAQRREPDPRGSTRAQGFGWRGRCRVLSQPNCADEAHPNRSEEEARTTAGRTRSMPSACRICGLILDDAERAICDECLPAYDRERTDKLSNVGKATLAAMRASSDDPARSPEATAKKREKSRSTSLAMRAWEREHGRGDPDLYERGDPASYSAR
jgi:hypothetical protein